VCCFFPVTTAAPSGLGWCHGLLESQWIPWHRVRWRPVTWDTAAAQGPKSKENGQEDQKTNLAHPPPRMEASRSHVHQSPHRIAVIFVQVAQISGLFSLSVQSRLLPLSTPGQERITFAPSLCLRPPFCPWPRCTIPSPAHNLLAVVLHLCEQTGLSGIAKQETAQTVRQGVCILIKHIGTSNPFWPHQCVSQTGCLEPKWYLALRAVPRV
jgi:hypothetical protein